jgi:hypothetical protein
MQLDTNMMPFGGGDHPMFVILNLFLSLGFAVGFQCTTSAFGDESRRMLIVFQCFVEYCSCHLHGEHS